MKKVLFIAPFQTGERFKGGITSFAESIIEHQETYNENGFELIPFNNCIVNRKTGTNGRLSLGNIKNFLKTKKALKKELKFKEYDAIYLNTSYGISLLKDLLTINKKYIIGKKVFLHIHFADIDNILTKKKLIRKLILKNLKSKITDIISLSSKLKNELIQMGLKENNIHVLYNYFSAEMTNSNALSISQKYLNVGTAENPLTFLFVGSFEKRKGFYNLVNVFKELNNSNIKLRLCGKPNDECAQKCLDEISNNELFIVEGYVSGEKKEEAFNNSHIMILPSYAEGLPITILEALNYGLPVISTSVGAIPEIIDDKIGTIIEPGNEEMLKKAILSYIEKRDTLYALSKNALEESNKYTYNAFSKNLCEIFITTFYHR